VKWEADSKATWELAVMCEAGGNELLGEFQAADEELSYKWRRRKGQAWVTEVEKGKRLGL
jgi:hypothetical protein